MEQREKEREKKDCCIWMPDIAPYLYFSLEINLSNFHAVKIGFTIHKAYPVRQQKAVATVFHLPGRKR